MIRVLVTFLSLLFCGFSFGQDQKDSAESLQSRMAQGWNTWNYESVLSHVKLPEGLSLNINFRQTFIGAPYDAEYLLEKVNIRKDGMVVPIAHSFDGTYTEILISGWKGNVIRVQSTTIADDVYILVVPEQSSGTKYTIELELGILWNKPGTLRYAGETLDATFENRDYTVRSTRRLLNQVYPYKTPYLCSSGDSAVAFYTGNKKTHEEIAALVASAKANFLDDNRAFPDFKNGYEALRSVIGWNTIYDPLKNRVITPVSRGWNEAWQGYVLFEWDTFFGALLASTGSKDLAYANVFALMDGPEQGHVGFWHMPGMEAVQSQPPVGSMVSWMIYERHKDKWFLEEIYQDLLDWNRWWIKNKMYSGYLAWSAPWKGADPHAIILETGLDNSPMYEDVPTRVIGNSTYLALADVGLNSLYAADCQYLAKIARELGKAADEKELLGRAKTFRKLVQGLWNEEHGIFLNKDLVTNRSSLRLSPTLFYPMLAGIPSPRQANRMIKEHFYNPNEFYGEYMLPSCSRNDPLFDNNYWRGSIWGPMNFLVYQGLKDYSARAAAELADKSYSLYETAWRDLHCVFENINSEKGAKSIEDQVNCDPFYHWGALMGYMKMTESSSKAANN